MVSMNFEGLVTNVDTSGSIMRYDLPQGLYGLPAEGNNMGVLFGPSESLPTNCSYPVDASTGFRIGEDTPDNSRCGRGVLGNGTVVLDSGECPAGQTPDQYADAYYFQPRVPVWRPDVGTCHQNVPQETLAAQKALFLKIATEVDGEELWNGPSTRGGRPPSAYNEFVFESKPSKFAAYIWAHEGPFEDIRDCPKRVSVSELKFGRCKLCELGKQLCQDNSDPRPDKPLIEIAQQNIASLNFGKLTYDNITSYKDVVENGGYDADLIFRELSWEDVCGDSFFSECGNCGNNGILFLKSTNPEEVISCVRPTFSNPDGGCCYDDSCYTPGSGSGCYTKPDGYKCCSYNNYGPDYFGGQGPVDCCGI